MKRCPTCSTPYEDDALSFCLKDGTVLVQEGPTSASFDSSAPMAPPPVADWSAPPAPAVPTSSSWGAVGNPPEAPDMAWGGGGYPQMQPSPSYVQNREQGMAIASLVCGVLSVACCLNVLTGIPAIVLGLISLNKEKSDPARYGGKGMAIGGIVLGAVSILGLLGYVILVFANALS